MQKMQDSCKEYFGVFGIVKNSRGEICLVQRGEYPWKGYMSLPGGSLEFKETEENALKREIREEIGINVNDIKIEKFFRVLKTYAEDFKAIFKGAIYCCSSTSSELKLQKNEILDAGFYSEKEAKKLKLAPITKLILNLYGWDIAINKEDQKFLIDKGSVINEGSVV